MNDMRTVGVAMIGLGARGLPTLKMLCSMENVTVRAVCDLYEDRLEKGAQTVLEIEGFRPFTTTDYREAVAREDVEAVIVCTSWNTHVPIALAAMRAGKHTATEVSGAYSVDECYDLVRTYEQTGRHCMLLENACYHRNRMALLQMVRRGMFGEPVHAEGAYAHDLRSEIIGGLENRHYRFRNFEHRDGDLYPTHGFGPIAKMLNINRGNRMVALASYSSKSRGMNEYSKANYGPDHPYSKIDWKTGDIVTTLIKCAGGETIKLVHDDTLPRARSRDFKLQGTRGLYVDFGGPNDQRYYIEENPAVPQKEEWRDFAAEYIDKYDHPLWKKISEEGGLIRNLAHGPIDELVVRGFIESVVRNIDPPIDTYDTASWMAITCLSEESVALGGATVAFPDFTRGAWIDRKPAPRSIYSLDDVCYELFDEKYCVLEEKKGV